MTKSNQFFRTVNFDWDRLRVEMDSDISLDYEFDIEPEQFLKFAELDIGGNNERAYVNALSNSKRAIDCQVDKILHCFKLNAKRQNFPAKIEILKELGIVAPRILRKVINKRNYLEHEYKSPEKEEVEDAIDVATLFIEASDRTLHVFLNRFTLGDEENMLDEAHRFKHCVYFIYREHDNEFELRGYNDDWKDVIRISSEDVEYRPILRLVVAIARQRNVDEAIQGLRHAVS
ncbi:MAG TPA: hypothetical protein VF703_17255 [Pyrinomonadaceae bacterium]|jgi:hypothetical protein